MGAWGSGILDDDTALDFLDELRDASDPIARMREALNAAPDMDYLGYDEGHAALVSAAVVDAVLFGTTVEGGGEGFDDWLKTLDIPQTKLLRPAAAKACQRVVAPASELNELWTENQEEYPRWRQQIEGLTSRFTE